MKKKIIGISIIALLFLPALLIAGCQKASHIPPDTFTATYQFADEERSISIGGNSDGMPGGQSQYVLKSIMVLTVGRVNIMSCYLIVIR